MILKLYFNFIMEKTFIYAFVDKLKLIVKNKLTLNIDNDEMHDFLKDISDKFLYSKKKFHDNLKKLDIDYISVNNTNPNTFNKGDKMIEICFIIELEDSNEIISFIEKNLKKQNIQLFDLEIIEQMEYVFAMVDKFIIISDKFIHLLNLDIGIIHLRKIIKDYEEESQICDICFDDVGDKLYINLKSCNKCSFRYCNKCLEIIKNCSSCNDLL